MKNFQERNNRVSLKQRIHETSRGGWIRAGIWSALYVAFVLWVAWGDWKSLGWLVLLPLIVDAFTTKYINYSWWKKFRPTPDPSLKGGEKGATETLREMLSFIPCFLG